MSPLPLATRPAWAASAGRWFLGTFAAQDAIVIVHLFMARLMLWRAPPHPDRAFCIGRIHLSLALFLVGVVVSRATTLGSARLRAFVYRVAIVGVLSYHYFLLRELLPVVRPDEVDGALHALDLRLFGIEPALWLERWNTPVIVEWFAFFYFSYYAIGIIYILACVFFQRDLEAVAEFGVGTALVFCAGYVGYMLVPGYGPVRHLAGAYQGPVAGGTMWGLILAMVEAGGAQKDIFPSLHTAVPTWFALYALWRSRRDLRWRWAAGPTLFFAMQIWVATLLLRWHYLVDVLAGMVVASSVFLLSVVVPRREAAARRRLGLPGVWDFARGGAGRARPGP